MRAWWRKWHDDVIIMSVFVGGTVSLCSLITLAKHQGWI